MTWLERIPRSMRLGLALMLIGVVWCRWGPMDALFDDPKSTVLLDREGALLGASVAVDGQWRMAVTNDLPARYTTCLLEFEDRHFRDHWGVHAPSLARAWMQNRKAGRTVSGGSTLTMQVARMSRGRTQRTIWNKLVEMAIALRIELRFSKDQILAMYAGNAPFGGNVVGYEAAAWRWFGRAPDRLTWAECALLAVLPNAPAQLHPGRNRSALKAKRDRLLDRLHAIGRLDAMEWSLAREEPLPDAPVPLPSLAPHLLSTLQQEGLAGTRIRSTIDATLQGYVTDLAERHGATLKANEVHNAAAIVLDARTGEVLAYVGNLLSAGSAHAGSVDIVRAPRSTGSLLKPFLYADMLQSSSLMPDQLVADIPTHYAGFIPRNFEQQFDGAVPASEALSRSLNIPAVRALEEHGVERTLRTLRAMGLHHLDRSADHYGLSLVVGGAESTLWELTGAYASLVRTAQHTASHNNAPGPVHDPRVTVGTDTQRDEERAMPILPAAAYHTLVALLNTNRPAPEAGWQQFSSSRYIAWKTGTSFGHRDAWAIGVTDAYAVGVWAGNASGEGRPGLTGSLAAAPLLFEIFDRLPPGRPFDPPFDAMRRLAVCRHSGYRTGPDCEPVDTLWVIAEAGRTGLCPWHRPVHVNASGTRRTSPDGEGRIVPWFALPPAMERYYAPLHPAYRPLPPMDLAAGGPDDGDPMEMIYPAQGTRVHVPLLLDGQFGKVVLEAAHRDAAAIVFWDLDGNHIGSTSGDHRSAVELPEGEHRLTLTDDRGRSMNVLFHVERGRTTGP